jgi:hypothetical protein
MNRISAFAGALLLASVVGVSAHASPTIIPVQGTLYDGAGEPINGSRDVTYRVYSSSSATAALWEGTITTSFSQGLFTSYLGQDDPINLVIFRDYSNIWIGVSIGTSAELGRFRVATAPFAGFADYCGEAVQLSAAASTAILNGAIERGDTRYAPLVHRTAWTSIDGIPAGFADGVDNDTDTTLNEAQVDAFVANNGYLTSASDLAWSRLSGIPAGFADGVDNDTVTTEAQVDTWVSNNGYLSSSSDLAWGRLTGVPAGFADGVDNDTTLSEVQVDAFVANNGYLTGASDLAWGRLAGVPAGFADGVDNDTVVSTAQIQAAVRGMAVVPTTDCFLTGYVNGYDQAVNYTCNPGYVLVGQASVHSNSTEDRIFQFRCCRMAIQ